MNPQQPAANVAPRNRGKKLLLAANMRATLNFAGKTLKRAAPNGRTYVKVPHPPGVLIWNESRVLVNVKINGTMTEAKIRESDQVSPIYKDPLPCIPTARGPVPVNTYGRALFPHEPVTLNGTVGEMQDVQEVGELVRLIGNMQHEWYKQIAERPSHFWTLDDPIWKEWAKNPREDAMIIDAIVLAKFPGDPEHVWHWIPEIRMWFFESPHYFLL